MSEKFDALIANKAESARYIVEEITHICKNMPKRSPGSEGERIASEYMADVLKDDCGCDHVQVETFKENPGSFYGWIWITFSLMFIGLILIFVGAPIIAVPLMLFGWVIALLQFGTYKKFIDKLFPELEGTNVTAIKSCTGTVERRIFFNGHSDAAWEWPVNYALGGVGFEGHAIISAVGTIFYIVIAIIAMAQGGLFAAPEGTLKTVALWGLLFTPFWVGMYFMWNRHRVVDGANDNLSGCYMGIAVLKAMKDAGIDLEHTEVGVILTGSEEAGLRGAKAWSEAHKDDFKDVPTFIYSYDTIFDPKYLMVNYRDLNATVKADKDVSDLFMEAAQELNLQCKKGMVPPLGGATDNAAFAQGGFRSTGITGLNHKLEDYYHTRRDTYDNMNEQGLADCFAVSVRVLDKFDQGEKQ